MSCFEAIKDQASEMFDLMRRCEEACNSKLAEFTMLENTSTVSMSEMLLQLIQFLQL